MDAMRPADIARNQKSHGFRPFSYIVEFSAERRATEFGSEDGPWTERAVVLNDVGVGYGAGDYVARFSMFHPLTSETTTGGSLGGEDTTPPKNGDLVRVWVIAEDLSSNRERNKLLQFKGAIRSVHEQRENGGIRYNCEAVSEVSRLNDVHVTLSVNMRFDPLFPAPRFDALGEVQNKPGTKVDTSKKTLAEIIDMILDAKDAWKTKEFFTKDDVIWNAHGVDLRESTRCGKYKPNQIVLEEVAKGRALEQVLQMAGNYTFYYDPSRDKLVIVEMSLRANHCGPKWEVRWPYQADNITQPAMRYAYEVDVAEDTTTWTSRQTANVCRVLGGRIRFYSGHYIIPRRTGLIKLNSDGTPAEPLQIVSGSEEANTTTELKDTAAKQIARSRNFEKAYYRFDNPARVADDRRKRQRHYVGMAMFPDWNVHADFLPALFRINQVSLPSEWTSGDTGLSDKAPKFFGHTFSDQNTLKKAYHVQSEWKPYSVGDQVSRGEMHRGLEDNLRVWQAWYATDACPACDGSGAVESIYTGSHNEPQIQWLTSIHGLTPHVVNYIFDPVKFGSRDPQTGELYPPTGLQPFSGSGYPVPHKNLCPYCRGVGLKPEYKIRNIQRQLIEAHNNQTPTDINNPAKEVVLDPDTTKAGPETWEQAQSRIAMRMEPQVQMEYPVATSKYHLPKFQNRDKPFEMVPTEAPDGVGFPEPQIQKFDHPLKFSSLRRRLADVVGLASGTDAGKIVPDSWYATCYWTGVRMGPSTPYVCDYAMGRLQFNHPTFIPCTKSISDFSSFGGKLELESNGLISIYTPGRGRITTDPAGNPMGYWRPPRIWMTFFYHRENFYDPIRRNKAGEAIEDKIVSWLSPEGETERYACRAAIIDGRYAVEVKKHVPKDTEQETEFSTGNRLIQTVITEPDSIIEIFEDDLYHDPVLPKPDMTKEEIETHKINNGYAYANGMVLQWNTVTPGERMLELDGYLPQDFAANPARPREYKFPLRDDRSRLLGRAIRALESQNDILVTGSVKLTACQSSHARGLGYVDYPGRGLATVKRINYSFGNDGMICDMELAKEEARFGELPQEAKDDIVTLQRRLAAIERRYLDTSVSVPGMTQNPIAFGGGGQIGGGE